MTAADGTEDAEGTEASVRKGTGGSSERQAAETGVASDKPTGDHPPPKNEDLADQSPPTFQVWRLRTWSNQEVVDFKTAAFLHGTPLVCFAIPALTSRRNVQGAILLLCAMRIVCFQTHRGRGLSPFSSYKGPYQAIWVCTLPASAQIL